MLATQKGRSKPVRTSLRRSEKDIGLSREYRIPRCESAFGGWLLAVGQKLRQPLLERGGGHARNAHHLVPAGGAGGYGNGGAREAQNLGQEFDTGAVGAALGGRGGERELEG